MDMPGVAVNGVFLQAGSEDEVEVSFLVLSSRTPSSAP